MNCSHTISPREIVADAARAPTVNDVGIVGADGGVQHGSFYMRPVIQDGSIASTLKVTPPPML